MIQNTDLPKVMKRLGEPLGPPSQFITNRVVGYIIGGLLMPLYRKRKVEVMMGIAGPQRIRIKMFYNYFDVLLALSRNSLVRLGGRKYKEIDLKKVNIHFAIE